jgi:hypothetical protein
VTAGTSGRSRSSLATAWVRREPRPAFSADELRREGVTEVAWHTPDELARSTERLAATRLQILVAGLLADDPRRTPIDVGV